MYLKEGLGFSLREVPALGASRGREVLSRGLPGAKSPALKLRTSLPSGLLKDSCFTLRHRICLLQSDKHQFFCA